MDDTAPPPDRLYTIGELAHRTGLPVKTIRFYSDSGVVPPTDRTHSGYRRYDIEAVTRLELVRTLRELGAGLDDIRHVLSSRTTLGHLARTHLDLVENQLRHLTTRRAVLRAVVKQDSTTEEVGLMHELAKMSDEERDRIIDEFWDHTTEGLNVNPEFIAWMRSAKPKLPDDPSTEQVEAWIELAELVGDSDFRRVVRELNTEQARLRDTGQEPDNSPAKHDGGLQVLEEIKSARAEGAAPESERAHSLVGRFAAMVAHDRDVADDAGFRRGLADDFERHDPRLTRYWELLAVINDWPRRGMVTADDTAWLVTALRSSAR